MGTRCSGEYISTHRYPKTAILAIMCFFVRTVTMEPRSRPLNPTTSMISPNPRPSIRIKQSLSQY